MAHNIVTTSAFIVDLVAVASIDAGLSAVTPNAVLYEAREGLREGGIELPGINALGNLGQDGGATRGAIAARAAGMVCFEPS